MGVLELLHAMQRATGEAATRERQAGATVADALRGTIDDQADTIAHLRAMLEDERETHAATRREVEKLRGTLGTRTRSTVPLRVLRD